MEAMARIEAIAGLEIVAWLERMAGLRLFGQGYVCMYENW